MSDTAASPRCEPGVNVRVFDESLGGALIDSARISVHAALTLLPEIPLPPQIILPGDGDDIDRSPTVHDCLSQAAQWLDAARLMVSEQSATPPTSLHVVKGGGHEPEARITTR
jgi:hypothetical protein